MVCTPAGGVLTTPIMQFATIGIVTLLALLLVIDWSTRLLVSEPVNTMKLAAIIDLIIGAMIALAILTVLWASLGGGEKASLVIALVFCGTVALELTDIAGSIKTSRYQIIKRQIALRPGKGHTEWWRILKWASAEYGDEFYRKLPRYWFRIISWSLLALAGIVLVSILGSCGADAKDTDQETASAAATPAPTAALLLATAIPTPTHTRSPTATPAPTATRFPTSTAAPASAGGGEFAAQRTRAAPTLSVVAILAPRKERATD